MSDVTTTRNGFPVIDVTHKPKRMQNANIKNRVGDENTSPSVGEETKVPNIVTLERAINFYESNAEGEYASLYSQTAKWLREFMSKSVPVNVDTPKEDA